MARALVGSSVDAWSELYTCIKHIFNNIVPLVCPGSPGVFEPIAAEKARRTYLPHLEISRIVSNSSNLSQC